jgi:hypothetical protein
MTMTMCTFWQRVEFDAEGVVGSFTRLEHDTCIASLCKVG